MMVNTRYAITGKQDPIGWDQLKKICRKCNIMKEEGPWGYKGDYIPGYNLYIYKTNTEAPF